MVPADLERVIAIADSLKDAPRWRPEAYLAALDTTTSPPRIALVAELPRTGRIVGFAVACLVPPQAELETIAVAAETQRSGVARRIFAALIEELENAQASEILLELRVGNRPALALYRSLGFESTGGRPRYYADPVEDAVLMRLPLR
jgi:ribosomal-protein-alanine N-acetyltransferase